MKIAILDDWQDVARTSADWSRLAARAELKFFADAFRSEDDAAAALADFDILLTMRERTAFPESLIRRLPKLRMIGITGAANPSLDVAACTRAGVTVCNTTGGGPGAPYATAELALGLMIAAARAIPAADRIMRAGGFQRGLPVGMSLAGKTLGIVGLGRLGARLARYALALDMSVIAWSPNLTREKAEEAGARLVGKSELMSGADVISVHMVLSPRSRGLIGPEDIARMKEGAILINTSRGPLSTRPLSSRRLRRAGSSRRSTSTTRSRCRRTIRSGARTIPCSRLISAMGSARRGASSIPRASRTPRPFWTASRSGS